MDQGADAAPMIHRERKGELHNCSVKGLNTDLHSIACGCSGSVQHNEKSPVSNTTNK